VWEIWLPQLGANSVAVEKHDHVLHRYRPHDLDGLRSPVAVYCKRVTELAIVVARNQIGVAATLPDK
jgi:hypothetical protein